MGRTASNDRSARLYTQRHKLLEQARRLARTGAHADHTSVIAELQAEEGFNEARTRLEDRAFKAQLDRLCALAQGRTI
jgi:uncharacterized membrane protein